MDAEQVINKILSDAKAEAEKISSQANRQRQAEQTKFGEELDEYKKQTEALAQKAAEDKKTHILAGARMQVAKELLAEKRRILDEVFNQAEEKLRSLSDDEYLSLMLKLMLKAVETGDEEVIVDKNETRIDQRFIKLVNRELGPGSKGNLRLSEKKADIGGGFILRRGKVKNNASLGVLLAQARKDLEMKLAKELFADSD